MCSVTMHDAQRRKIDGYKRCQSIRRSDPRGSEDEKQSVRQLSMAKFGAQKRERMEDNLFNSDDDDDDRVATGACHSLPAAPCPNSCPDPPCSCPLFAICLFFFCSTPAGGQRRTKRTAKATDVTNMGSDALYPSRQARQTGSAHSSLAQSEPPTPQLDEVLNIVENLTGILKVNPEHAKCVKAAADLIGKQALRIEELQDTLQNVLEELGGMEERGKGRWT